MSIKKASNNYGDNKYTGYHPSKQLKIYRSKAWMDLIVVKYRSYEGLIDYLQEVWDGGNHRALRIAFETTVVLRKELPEWIIKGVSNSLKVSLRDQAYTKNYLKEIKRRVRDLERWNAWIRAKEEGLKSGKAYEFALKLLKRQDMHFASSHKSIANTHSKVNIALKSQTEKRKYIVVSLPSPFDNAEEFEQLTKDWE